MLRLPAQHAFAYTNQILSVLSTSALNLGLPWIMGATGYGRFAVWIGVTYSALAVFDPGANLTSVRFRLPLGIVITSKLALAVIPAGAAFLIDLSRFGQTDLALAFAGAALVVVLSFMTTFDTELTSRDRNERAMRARLLLATTVFPATALGYVLSGSVASAAVAMLLAFCVGAAYSWHLAGRALPEFGGRSVFRRFVTSALGLSVVSGGFALATSGVIALSSFTLSAPDSANLKLALSVATAGAAVVPLPGLFLFSRFSALSGDSHALGGELSRQIRLAVLVGGGAALLVGVGGPRIITMLYGPSYSGSALLLPFASALIPIQSLELPLLGAFLARSVSGARSRQTTTGIMCAAIVVLASPLAANISGLLGALACSLVAHSLIVGVMLLRVTRSHGGGR